MGWLHDKMRSWLLGQTDQEPDCVLEVWVRRRKQIVRESVKAVGRTGTYLYCEGITTPGPCLVSTRQAVHPEQAKRLFRHFTATQSNSSLIWGSDGKKADPGVLNG